MKKTIFCLAAATMVISGYFADAQLFNKLKSDIKNGVNSSISKPSNNAGTTGNSLASAKTTAAAADPQPATAAPSASPSTTASNSNANDSGDIKVYNNYDFVPGQTVLFEDHFTDDQDGEFPAHWKLDKGQAVMNSVNGVNALLLTDGNFAQVYPRMKKPAYLTDPFTLELDYMTVKAGGYGLVFMMINAEKSIAIHVREDGTCEDGHVSSAYPADHSPETYRNKWHHVALSFKNGQIKIYVDQYRVLADPDFGMTPTSFIICSAPDPGRPTVFSNVRLASGAGMNMIGKKFTDTKIITHGINFDYNKATLKPESMGTLNMILKVMNDNPDLKFEVGGHTDGDGDAAYNLKLSQQRADAVRTQLIAMGIDAARLKAKGYGKTKPIADNTTDEGKANNRRVEFVKI